VLSRMLRQYTRDEYMRRIDWMKNAKRDIAITTDIIVGFPGETEKEFEETLKLVDEVQYESMFSFKYSKRPNTPALQYEDHLPEEEKQRRLAILQEKQRQIQIRRNAVYVGQVHDVLVEGYNQATGQWFGKTSQHKQLNFTQAGAGVEAALQGTYQPVRVTRAGPNSLVGESLQ
jgi:tRNA-2-methylthio-N6-dimethylallyladenosine synthase